MALSFGNMTVELNMFNASPQPLNKDDLCEVIIITNVVNDFNLNFLGDDPLEKCFYSFWLGF